MDLDPLENYVFVKPYQKDFLMAMNNKDLKQAQMILMLAEKESPINFEEFLFRLFHFRYGWLKDEVKPLADITELFLDCGAKVNYAEARYEGEPKEDLFDFAIQLSKPHLLDLTRLMLEYGADPNVNPLDNDPYVLLPSLRGYWDIVLLLIQFGSEEKFDQESISSWNTDSWNFQTPPEKFAEIIENERKKIKEGGIKKVMKVPTFSLWPEGQRIEKLMAHGWSKEKIEELMEKEKINRNVAKTFFNIPLAQNKEANSFSVVRKKKVIEEGKFAHED